MKTQIPDYEKRKQRLCIEGRALGVGDTIILTSPRSVQYLSGFIVDGVSQADYSPAYFVLDVDNCISTLIVHNLPAVVAQSAHADRCLHWNLYDAATQSAGARFRDGVRYLLNIIDPHGPIGIETGSFPHIGLDSQLVDMTDVLASMRRVKELAELDAIRNALSVVEEGYREARRILCPGITEISVFASVLHAMTVHAGTAINLNGDFISGSRATRIVGPATRRTLVRGEPVILDMAPIVLGYRADTAATFVVGEPPSGRQAELEYALHNALEVGETRLYPGSKASSVYDAVSDALYQSGFRGAFPHHAGHGLGLEHPEAPYFVPQSTEILVPGDVVTLEPGAYGTDFAGRIEHDYLITATGFERLSAHDTSFTI